MPDNPRLPPVPEPSHEPLPLLGDAVDVEATTIANSLSGQTIRELFGNRNFVPLWIGQMVSYIGDEFLLVAALALVAKLVGSNSGLYDAGLGIANAAPSIVLGLLGGVLVDRLDRKLVMMISDIVRGLALFSLLLINNDPSRLWLFFVALMVTGAASTLFYPARASALPAIVSKRNLAAANALIEAGFVIGLILGSALAGVLIKQFGPNIAFALNGSAYLFSALMIFIMKIPPRVVVHSAQTAGSASSEVWRELRDGLRYIWKTRSMRYIMGLSVMVAGSIGAVLILALNYLDQDLHVGADAYGFVIALLGVGIVIGGVLIRQLSRYLPTNRLVGAAMALNGFAVLGFVLHPVFAVVCVFTALIGFSVVVARAVLSTLVQAIPPEEYRGRVQSAFNLIFSAPLAVAVGLAGLLLKLFTIEQSFALSGFNAPLGLTLTNKGGNQWVVFAGFGAALLLTALLAVNMLRGIDEAVYSESS